MKKILLILIALTVSAAAFAEKITTVAGITSGNKYYIGATTSSTDYYFYVDGSSKTESIKGVAKEDVADAVALTFTEVTGGWTIKFDNGLYLGIKNQKDNGAVQVLEEAMVWKIEEDKGLLKLHPNDYYLQKNRSNTQFGSFNANQTNVWLEFAGSAPVSATFEGLVIKGTATKMEYEVGEAFDPAGLEVWGIYTKYVKNDSTSLIKSGITWSLDPETFKEATDNASVTLSASFNDKTSEDKTITGIKVNAVVPGRLAPCCINGKKLTINDLKDSELVYFQYFKYKNDERINSIIKGSSDKNVISLFDTEGYCEINYTNKDEVKRNFIVNPKIENAVDSIYQGETYLFADTLLTTAGTYQRTIESNTMTLTLKVKQKPVKYTTYENWQIKYEGSDWVNMTKVEEGLFKLVDINWTGSGFNVKSDDNPIKKDSYAADDPDVHIDDGVKDITLPVTVDVYLRIIDDEHLRIGVGVAPPIQFVDTASGLKFEITSMEEPRTVKVIYNDYKGTSCTVPGTVTYGEETFDVTEIGVEAFHDCADLESITLPESVTTLAYASLAASGLKSITIPATVTTIGEYAFAGCPLQSVTFQGNACQDTIGDNAFEDVGTTTTPATLTLPDDWAGSTPENSETPWYGGYFDYDAPAPASGPTVDETGITVNGRKYGFPVRLVKEVPAAGVSGNGTEQYNNNSNPDWFSK